MNNIQEIPIFPNYITDIIEEEIKFITKLRFQYNDKFYFKKISYTFYNQFYTEINYIEHINKFMKKIYIELITTKVDLTLQDDDMSFVFILDDNQKSEIERVEKLNNE